MPKKRKLFLVITLLCIFAMSSIIGISILEKTDSEKSDQEPNPDEVPREETIIEKTVKALGSPFEDLLRTKDIFKKKEEQVVSIKIPILLYHYVEVVKDDKDTIRKSLNTEPKVFEQQIISLKNAGYMFIWPREIPDIVKNKDLQYGKYVILSFDDGYKDFYTDAYPIIKKHNVKAVNYVPYFFIDTPNYMETQDIKEIVEDNLVEIGSHTLRHASLTSLNNEKAKEEIENSKKYLEAKFETQVDSFAYPYGFYNSDIAKIVENAGYSNATTIDKGNIVTKNNLFELKRIRPGIATGDALINWISAN